MAKGSDGKELHVVIRLSGEFVGSRVAEAKEYVGMVREATGIPLKGEASEVMTEAYQWTLLQHARHGWRGDVVVRLATKSEVLHMYAAVEGKTIAVTDGGRIVIEVVPHISLIEEARNGRSAGHGGSSR